MVHTKVELKVSVQHWRHEDGEPVFVGKSVIYPDGFRPSPPKGWYCWAYPSDDRAFEEWMARTCPKAECQHRFNSGDPMYTVQLFNEKEALLFQLAWVK
jgi:hypothetical protein